MSRANITGTCYMGKNEEYVPLSGEELDWAMRSMQATVLMGVDSNHSKVSPVYKTGMGVKYLKGPGFKLAGMTQMNPSFEDLYLAECGDPDRYNAVVSDTTARGNDSSLMAKRMGQICYASWGDTRTPDSELNKYMDNILNQRHYSILEHVQVSYMIWGVSRSLVMEFDRQRHLSWSQLSQRYCDETTLRFVERPEFQDSEEMHEAFMEGIDEFYATYTSWKMVLQQRADISGTVRSRKAVNQAARWCLPNCTEVVLGVSGNLLAWRHFLCIRGQQAAEPEIRILAASLATSLKHLAPAAFQDVEVEEGDDGYPLVIITHWS